TTMCEHISKSGKKCAYKRHKQWCGYHNPKGYHKNHLFANKRTEESENQQKANDKKQPQFSFYTYIIIYYFLIILPRKLNKIIATAEDIKLYVIQMDTLMHTSTIHIEKIYKDIINEQAYRAPFLSGFSKTEATIIQNQQARAHYEEFKHSLKQPMSFTKFMSPSTSPSTSPHRRFKSDTSFNLFSFKIFT